MDCMYNLRDGSNGDNSGDSSTNSDSSSDSSRGNSSGSSGETSSSRNMISSNSSSSTSSNVVGIGNPVEIRRVETDNIVEDNISKFMVFEGYALWSSK